MGCFIPIWSILHESSISFWVGKSFKEGGESVRDGERCGRSKEVNRPELIGQRVRVRIRVTMLGFYGCSRRDSLRRVQHSWNRVSGIPTRTMHQSTIPYEKGLETYLMILVPLVVSHDIKNAFASLHRLQILIYQSRGSSRPGTMVKVMTCSVEVSKFELHLHN